MPLWNKRAVSSGQTEESYKEQLQSLKQTVNNLGLVSEQFEGAAEGLTESSDKVGHGVQVLAEGASRQERDVLQCRKIAEEQGYQVISVVGGIQAYRGKQLEGNFH